MVPSGGKYGKKSLEHDFFYRVFFWEEINLYYLFHRYPDKIRFAMRQITTGAGENFYGYGLTVVHCNWFRGI
jgi:hypothetical protein